MAKWLSTVRAIYKTMRIPKTVSKVSELVFDDAPAVFAFDFEFLFGFAVVYYFNCHIFPIYEYCL